MQQPPSAADLLAAVADVLEHDVVPGLSGPVQHRARVAANLVAIVERELRLGEAAAVREHAALADLLDGAIDGGSDLGALRDQLAAALRHGLADDDATDARVWQALMAVVRGDLAIAKPGHDAWEGD